MYSDRSFDILKKSIILVEMNINAFCKVHIVTYSDILACYIYSVAVLSDNQFNTRCYQVITSSTMTSK